MIFSRDVFKRFTLVGAMTAVIGTVLVGCGGGEQEQTFRPARMVVFGDENTLIAPNGYQYTVNNDTVAGATPCKTNVNWVQVIALNYGLSFAECDGLAPVASAQMKAAAGATVASVRTAYGAFNAATPIGATDLVTLMVGTHDVLGLYEANPTPTTTQQADMVAVARARGRELGDLVFDVTARGAKVVFATVPKLNLAPIGQETDAARRNVLFQLSTAFNEGLSDRVSDDPNGGGRDGAVIEIDQLLERYQRNDNGIYTAFVNVLQAACVVDSTVTTPVTQADDKLVTDCKTSNATSVRAATASRYLWAGRFHFGAITHLQIGTDAYERLRNNPL